MGSGSDGIISNSYYAARNNGVGEERSFAELRCPTEPGEICPLGSQESTYEGWDTSVWNFGSATDLPQLSSNWNFNLNRKPYIKNSTELVVRIGFTGITQFSLEADYPGLLGEPATLTWSLSGVPPPLRHLVYLYLGDGTTGTTFVDREKFTRSTSTVTLVVVGNEELVGKSIYVELKNSIFNNVDRLPIRVVGLSPSVDDGREQNEMIWDGSTRTILVFSATNRDSPDYGGAGLSWNILSTDIAEGSTVVFSGSQTGGTVEVEVRRDTLGSVGSLVLEVTSPAGAKTTFTVTIETMCSAVPGEDLMAGQTGTGTSDDRYQIKRLCQLQDIGSNPSAHYELVSDIDASKTKDWNNGTGFDPIAIGEEDGFEGSFVNASNHEISSLTISRSDTSYVGLFSELARNGKIEGIRLAGSRTTGHDRVGSLVGYNAGVIEDCSATGSVFGDNFVGGLAGVSQGDINNSYATGSISGDDYVGGLVGFQDNRISSSYAMGSVSGGEQVGGLVGRQVVNSTISDSYATGLVSGQKNVGGLVGLSEGSIGNGYATGSISGDDYVGGLVGYQEPESNISDSYATDSVSGKRNVGGLVGTGHGDVNNSYATGFVYGVENVGGLAGSFNGDISNSYYAARGWNNGLGEERTFAQLRCPTESGETCPPDPQESALSYRGWDTSVWNFGSTADLPQLLSNRNVDLNRKSYIKVPTELIVGIGGVTHFPLDADYPGALVELGTLTWSLSDVPIMLRDLVYFVDLEDGTTSTEANGSVATLAVVRDETLTGKSFHVVLRNDISAGDDRIRVRIVGSSLLMAGGGMRIGTIRERSTRTVLDFRAIDPDRPGSDGAGLEWNFTSKNGVAAGSTVEFRGSQTGGTVEVEVIRDSFGPVGSFVLEVTSPAGVKTTFTVTIETACSAVWGEDLMAGQTGAGTLDNPYQIETLCQLQDIRSNLRAHYELATDIDASETKDWNGGAGFEPIAIDSGFLGSFVNASTHEIRSLTISRSDTNYVGLFSVFS